jgi:hypothetical protein
MLSLTCNWHDQVKRECIRKGIELILPAVVVFLCKHQPLLLMKNLIFFLIITLIFSSCNTHVSIQKRRYRPGFFVEIQKNDKERTHFKASKSPLFEINLAQKSQSDSSLSKLTDEEFLTREIVTEHSSHRVLAKPARQATEQKRVEIAQHGHAISEDQRASNSSKNIDKDRKNTNRSFALWSAWVGLLITMSSLLYFIRNRARKISQWASKNRRKSWLIIAIGHIILGVSALFAGNELAYQKVDLGTHTTFISLLVSGVLALYYKIKISKFQRFKGYIKRKIAELMMLSLGLVGLISFGNDAGHDRINTAAGSWVKTAVLPDHSLVDLNGFSLYQNESAEIEHSISKDPDKVWNFIIKLILILLALALAYVLFMLLGVLACNLICSGLEQLAAVAAVAGTLLIVILTAWLIKKIARMQFF